LCELTAALDDIQPKILRHLAVLTDVGIVIVRCEAAFQLMAALYVVINGKVVNAGGVPTRSKVAGRL
jgi:hypothetical protein